MEEKNKKTEKNLENLIRIKNKREFSWIRGPLETDPEWLAFLHYLHKRNATEDDLSFSSGLKIKDIRDAKEKFSWVKRSIEYDRYSEYVHVSARMARNVNRANWLFQKTKDMIDDEETSQSEKKNLLTLCLKTIEVQQDILLKLREDRIEEKQKEDPVTDDQPSDNITDIGKLAKDVQDHLEKYRSYNL